MAPETNLAEDDLSGDQGSGGGFRMIQVRYIGADLLVGGRSPTGLDQDLAEARRLETPAL